MPLNSDLVQRIKTRHKQHSISIMEVKQRQIKKKINLQLQALK